MYCIILAEIFYRRLYVTAVWPASRRHLGQPTYVDIAVPKRRHTIEPTSTISRTIRFAYINYAIFLSIFLLALFYVCR